MASEITELTLMRIFVGEGDRIDGKIVYEEIVKLLRNEKISGATVIRGIEGFGAKSHLHKASVITLSHNLPIIIEAIDNRDRLDAIVPKLDDLIEEGLVTFEKVSAVRFDKQK